jgi:hypothetical protein
MPGRYLLARLHSRFCQSDPDPLRCAFTACRRTDIAGLGIRTLRNRRHDLRLLLDELPCASTENEMRFLALGFLALALLPAVSHAQQSTELAQSGPTLQSASIGFRVNDNKVDRAGNLSTAPLLQRHQGQDVALMAVGVGAMIIGALVGDTAGTVIIIGGAAMALFGLYHYLE